MADITQLNDDTTAGDPKAAAEEFSLVSVERRKFATE